MCEEKFKKFIWVQSGVSGLLLITPLSLCFILLTLLVDGVLCPVALYMCEVFVSLFKG